MAEIRSTLDIIMEKTKNMTMSDEEKLEFRIQTLTGKTKGWVQRFLDNIIGLEKLKIEIEAEKQKDPEQLENLLKQELVGRLDPDKENDKIFHMLEELLEIDTKPFIHIIGEFHEKVINEKTSKIETFHQSLVEKGVSGPAVVPNIDSDPDWLAFYEAEKETCIKNLTGLTGSTR